MASIVAAQAPQWRERARAGAARSGQIAIGTALLALVVIAAGALATHHTSDPSLNTAAGGPALNLFGTAGAWLADLLLAIGGVPIALALPLALLAGVRALRGADRRARRRDVALTALAVLLAGAGATVWDDRAVSGLPAGWGGVLGMAGGRGAEALVALIGDPRIARMVTIAVALTLGLAGVVTCWFGLGLSAAERGMVFRRREPAIAEDELEDWAPSSQEIDEVLEPELADEQPEPPRAPGRRRPEVVRDPADERRPVIADPKPAPASKPAGTPKERQTSLNLGEFVLPGIELLKPAPPSTGGVVDKAGLERNARLLESVLEDFHVKGRIVEVRPGPVVTMYELEPAPGIKASRVIALADDIARNMSALSARVATVAGKNVIGIELPNVRREMVSLSELVSSDAFSDHPGGGLPMILGKNIEGGSVVADLAPMPHLLVAGTTGSGKSVGLNCMILSLLYRLTPDECRMIMIDPKMLELSIYDDIPHLLAPVVTDPPKAIRALKWAVEQMEERYRMMASIGVRGLASYNEKVRAAKAKGQTLARRVQTGYDAETGQPIIEQEELDYEVLPQIVVIVDELADLMMTAGKEVEFLIQRLAQKARAAGIHLIMATQRPSVDVITGVIKANLPTRISFQVTSKIDSRTILGEQGAEQLLGKGDMLYMQGGKQIVRVHGPFVSDEEVRAVTDHWRAQRAPVYVASVTEEPIDGGFALEGAPTGEDSADDQLYRKGVEVVATSQKASISYVQRQLRIGYNSAARLIERMEKEGVVGRPDHVGRREVLVDTDGRPV